MANAKHGKGKGKGKGKGEKKKAGKKAGKKTGKKTGKETGKKTGKETGKKLSKKAGKKADKKAGGKAARVAPVPAGYHTLMPHLVLEGAHEAIAFYGRAFGAKVRTLMPGPDNTVAHGELVMFGSTLMLSDMFTDGTAQPPSKLGGTSAGVMLYVEDVDAVYAGAVAAGARTLQEPTDMFWGDRYAKVLDPFGHIWAIATHIEDVSEKEMRKRLAAMHAPPAAPTQSDA